MMKKLMLILSCLCLSIGLIQAQTTSISGTVLDDAGMEVIGASVVVKGTTVGVATDIDGKFTLNLPSPNETLVFSLVGMKKVEMKASNNMRVVMNNDEALLEEVIVTAMGISREKKALGYASQGVKAENLVQASNSSLSGALQGKVSGVNITPSSGMPGASSRIVIRGARSFTGNNTPLYVIDGMPVNSGADISTGNSTAGADIANRAVDIDPNDIESVEILKGQAASALYGLRASNGVIAITTKSGRGVAKGKPVISVSSNVSFDKVSRYPKLQSNYAQGAGGTFDPEGSLSWGPQISELPNDPAYGGQSKNPYTDKYGMQPGKYYVPQLAKAGLNPWASPKSYNTMKDFFDTGVTWSNSVNVSQALEKSSYSMSLGTTDQDGIIPGTGMSRYTGKISAETTLTNHFKAGFVGNFVKTSIDKAPTANDGVLATIYASPVSYDYKGIPTTVEGNPYTQTHYRRSGFENAYWGSENNNFREKTHRFYGNMHAEYATKLNSLDKKLRIRYQIGTDAYTTLYSDKWSYGSRVKPGGQIENSSWTSNSLNSLVNAFFDWTINDDFNLSTMAGNELIQESQRYNYSYGANFAFPGWDHIDNATAHSSESQYLSQRTVGFFANASLGFRNMLYLDLTGRQDYVSTMPRGNRSFFYPSVGASMIVSELEGVKNDIIDFLKVRLSYAEVGQAGNFKNNYYYKPNYGGGFFQGEPIKYPIGGVNGLTSYLRLYDPELKPQNTRSYEFGFDVTLLNGLFDLAATYSRQNVKNQIFAIPLPGSTGFNDMISNGGSMHTNAYEVTLNANPVRTKLIDWSIGLNWSKIDNYVDELADGVDNISLGGFVTPQIRVAKGQKYPVIYGSDYARDSQGRILVQDDPKKPGYGAPTKGKDDVIGSISPDFILGFHTSLRIEKVRIAAVFEWKSGGQMYHGTNGLLNFYGIGQDTQDRTTPVIFDGWKSDGTKNDILVQPEGLSDYYSTVNGIDAASVWGTSFLKLRELSASYPVWNKFGVEVNVSAFARNILLWSELPNFDPEASQGNNNMAGGFERFSLPQTSSYGMGLNVKF